MLFAVGVGLAVLLGPGRPRAWLAAVLVSTAVLAAGSSPPRGFEAVFLDVGQGDALLLRDGRRTLLVDGGGLPHGDVATRVLLPSLARLGVRRIDVALLTHGDHDHCAGLLELERWIPVRELWVGPTAGHAACGSALVDRAGARVSVLSNGERRRLGRFELEVLHAPQHAASSNAGSVVVAVSGGGRRLLLAADIESEVERALLSSGAPLRANLLKVAHHGSRTSTSDAFLAAVDPTFAVVQAGRGNVYGHPAAQVLERLAARRTLVMRTDLDGQVLLAWDDGGPWRLSTGRPRRAGLDGMPSLFGIDVPDVPRARPLH
jgi:competence protein ComEC